MNGEWDGRRLKKGATSHGIEPVHWLRERTVAAGAQSEVFKREVANGVVAVLIIDVLTGTVPVERLRTPYI